MKKTNGKREDVDDLLRVLPTLSPPYFDLTGEDGEGNKFTDVYNNNNTVVVGIVETHQYKYKSTIITVRKISILYIHLKSSSIHFITLSVQCTSFCLSKSIILCKKRK